MKKNTHSNPGYLLNTVTEVAEHNDVNLIYLAMREVRTHNLKMLNLFLTIFVCEMKATGNYLLLLKTCRQTVIY